MGGIITITMNTVRIKPVAMAMISAGFLLSSCQQAGEDAATAPETLSPEAPPEAPSPAQRSPAPEDVAAARAAAVALRDALFAALTDAMTEGGIERAVAVCNEAAPEIAAGLSASRDMEIGRTALRVRNPDNAPDAWERAQLDAFAVRHETGEAFAGMEHAEVVTQDGAAVFRWMKPIPMGGLCAACHGENIEPATLAAIRALYPEDEATGFAPGALRGAFTVKKALGTPSSP